MVVRSRDFCKQTTTIKDTGRSNTEVEQLDNTLSRKPYTGPVAQMEQDFGSPSERDFGWVTAAPHYWH